MSAVDKLIEIAKAEVGYLEKRSNSNLYNKTANAGSGNYTKYWADIAPSYQGQPWCAGFVTWVLLQAVGKDETRQLLKHYPYVYCPTLGVLHTQHTEPKRGAIVLFYRGGEFAHTGIVESVSGSTVTTIEGNTSGGSTIIANGGAVCRKTYNINDLPGTRYVYPDYKEDDLTMTQYEELKAADAAKDEIINTMGQEIAQLKQDAAAYKQQIANIIAVLQSTMIYDYVDDNMPDWARNAVTAAMQSGAVNGDEGGKLGLSYKDLRSISREYRQGLYDHQAVHD